MAAYVKFYQFSQDLAHKVHNLGSDTLKVGLSNTAPSQSNAVLADLTEIANGNGYTTGGTTSTQSSSGQTTGTYKLVIADVVFTASGGSMAAWRYVFLYNSTPASPLKPLISYWDYGSSVTLASTETLTVDFDGTNGVLQLA